MKPLPWSLRRKVGAGRSLSLFFIIGVALATLACSPARFPKELFTVQGQGADYPVMISRTTTDNRGRVIHAESGTHFSQSSSSYSAGNTTVTVTTTRTAKSERSASDKLITQVRRDERVMLIEHVEFFAEDYSGYGFSYADSTLNIDAKVTK